MHVTNKLKINVIAVFMLVNMIVLPISIAGEYNTTIVLNITGEPPLNDSKMQGFMDRVAVEAFKRIGIILKTVRLPAERGLLTANNHKIDGEMSRIAGMQKTYVNLVRVPEKIMDWEFVAIGEAKLNTQSGWQSLENKRVAFINGWKILEKNIIPVNKVKGAESLFRLLKNKRVEYVVYERWAGAKYVQDLLNNNVSIILPALAKREMFIYLHKDHEKLVSKLAASLQSMKSDGTYNKIKKQILMQYSNN